MFYNKEFFLKINPEDVTNQDKKVEINMEEIKKKVETQEDRDDDPEDFEEFADEKTRISKVPVQDENSFGFLPEKHKIDVIICY